MLGDLRVGAWVAVRDGCPMTYTWHGDDVEFRLGGQFDGFEFQFSSDTLRRFVDLASQAVRDRQRDDHR